MSVWNELHAELDLWQAEGKGPELWWRDDDAIEDSANLRRLSEISKTANLPLCLAVIPDGADASLNDVFVDNSNLFGFQHGFTHMNHAPEDQRKMELGDHRPLEEIGKELLAGQHILQDLLNDSFYPVLVPPWNRISSLLVANLKHFDFVGLSSRKPRANPPGHGLIEINVHVDLIDWNQRRFAGDDKVLGQLISHLRAKREAKVDAKEPTGIMTHHLVHDEGCWSFLHRLFESLNGTDVHWCYPDQMFTSPD